MDVIRERIARRGCGENTHTLVEERIRQLYFFEQLLCRVFVGIDLVA